MKVALWIFGAVVALIATYVGLLLLTADADMVTNNYASLEDARAAHLFARGWLPEILPASSRDIRTSNNLDLNTSEGEFHFLEADYPAFVSRLTPYNALRAPGFAEHVRKMQERGFLVGVFAQDSSTWLFLCEVRKGYCEYTMWLDRVATP